MSLFPNLADVLKGLYTLPTLLLKALNTMPWQQGFSDKDTYLASTTLILWEESLEKAGQTHMSRPWTLPRDMRPMK